MDKKKMQFGRKAAVMLATRLSILVWGIYLVYGGMCYFRGFDFFFNTKYGWEAVLDCLTVYGYLYWPVLLACALIIIGGSAYLIRSNKAEKEEREG